jgi:nucleotide-binding universal stress UspA family protein
MKYVLGTDGSEHGLKAARWLVKHLRPGAGDEVYMVYVFPLPPDAETFAHLVAMPRDASDERVCAVARPVLDGTRGVLGDIAACIHEVVLVGYPAEEIVQFASTQQVDLIITGNRGRGARKEQYLGSVSGAVAQRALCPVLLVR